MKVPDLEAGDPNLGPRECDHCRVQGFRKVQLGRRDLAVSLRQERLGPSSSGDLVAPAINIMKLFACNRWQQKLYSDFRKCMIFRKTNFYKC